MTQQISNIEVSEEQGISLKVILARETWIGPSVLMTALLSAFTLSRLPKYGSVMPALELLPLWIVVSVIFGAIYYFFWCVNRNISNPFSLLFSNRTSNLEVLVPILLLIVISGMNMVAFMWIKPYLNSVIPFWADPMLANIDRAIFLGHDPWSLIQGLNTDALVYIYHRGWFAFLILAILNIAAQPPSLTKSSLIVTYFALWTFVGPLVHSLLPAAGPIFFSDLGYGDRFAELHTISGTADMSDYLWTHFASGDFGPGVGISAMPSMHIATSVWAVIAIAACAPKLRYFAMAFCLLMVMLSVALGWHYFIDGVVGGLSTLAVYVCARRLLPEPFHLVRGVAA